MAEAVWSTLLFLYVSYVCSHALQIPSEDRRLTLVYRRGDVSGLFPFPRVGRSQPSYEGLFGQRSQGGGSHGLLSKRQGLIPFPRVGKRQQIPIFPGPALFGPRVPDAFYDEYARGRPVKGARGAMATPPVSEEEDPWGTSAEGLTEGKRSGGEGTAQEGMWFGPRLGRRRRRSSEGQAGGAAKHRPRPEPFWGDDGGSRREYLERRPDLNSNLQRKEQLHSVEDDEDDLIPSEDLLYGDASETPGDEVREEESSSMVGRRRRRQPEDSGTKKGEKSPGEGRQQGAASRWEGGPGRA